MIQLSAVSRLLLWLHFPGQLVVVSLRRRGAFLMQIHDSVTAGIAPAAAVIISLAGASFD